MKQVLFVINSKAGTKRNINFQKEIENVLQVTVLYDFLNWKNPDQDIVTDIQVAIKEKKYDIVASVGGDGTMNKVASALLNTSIPMLILPLGSGNGLARHLQIPMNWRKAIELIYSGKTIRIDSGTVNNQAFFCTSGVGFDAHIGHLFSTAPKRGFTSYFKLTLRELFTYKPQQYTITIDGTTKSMQAFLITVANANQWGNNIFIAPMASLNDEHFHVIILKPFKLWQIPSIGIKLLTKKTKNNRQFIVLKGKQILITTDEEANTHYDGEPEKSGKEINYTIVPQSLSVLVP